MSYDINANVFMYDVVEVGVGYRLEDSFSGMINFHGATFLAPCFSIGLKG